MYWIGGMSQAVLGDFYDVTLIKSFEALQAVVSTAC